MVASDDIERRFWNGWTSAHGDRSSHVVSRDQLDTITRWLRATSHATLLDVGCGSGWMTQALTAYGTAVGTDLADETLDVASERYPNATFVSGDFMTVDVGADFDVIVTLEVLSHVQDQLAFVRRLHSLLRPGGRLMLASQNRPVLQRFNRIAPPAPGQARRWVDRRELHDLLTRSGFVVDEMRVRTPMADHGAMRYVAKVGRTLGLARALEKGGFGWTIMALATRV